MLAQLELLASKIEQLISVNQHSRQHNETLLAELELTKTKCENALKNVEQLYQERDALRLNRDQLARKINDAHIRLSTILEELQSITNQNR
ncbi:ATPase [Candidatus Pandoraea novymonadis]|uniref:Chromosome partition protein Smc n=1 Tax=Candidatus Pandoraea novymonadis TaxID=1808959 RepID=A0ABX5FEV1_9BURK|nr:ATPase [Candidatus Pandoraea novymonadis]PSB92225.1 hypothetical protein BZL35_00460 [Candidatus Pandoraea novymonadis]